MKDAPTAAMFKEGATAKDRTPRAVLIAAKRLVEGASLLVSDLYL